MQDRIINLVGASGTGKTTIAKHLKGKGFNIIKSYTTRKPRRENEWGHIFIRGNWEVVDLFCAIDRRGNDIEIPKGNMIAYKNLYRDHYFATKEQYQGKGTSIYIVDPDGAEQVKRDVDDAEVITIALNADKENRMHRIRGRLTKQYLGDMTTVREELRGRINKDREIFKIVKCDYTVDVNREVEEVLKDILEIINA